MVNSEDTPQTRLRLASKIGNVFPGCRPEWLAGQRRGLAFRLVDEQGRYRSNVVQIYRVDERVFTRRYIEQAVHMAGWPDAGQPRA